MKLIEIYKRLGKQPLRVTQHKDAIVLINGDEYEITNIKYDSGKFIGFEAKPKFEWFSAEIKPKEDTWVIVKDKDGKEYDDHQWLGHAWYSFIIDGTDQDGCIIYDGWRTDVENIVAWRYQYEREHTKRM